MMKSNFLLGIIIIVLLYVSCSEHQVEGSVLVLPVEEVGKGKFSVPVSIGTPLVQYATFIATASPDLVVASTLCTPWCNYSPAYDRLNSSTSTSLCDVQPTCTFDETFAGHAAEALGNSYLDVVVVGGAIISNASFGAWTSIQNMHTLVPAPMSGVFGLLPAPSQSAITNNTIMNQLYNQGQIESLSYSICLGQYGGMLLLGGIDENLRSGSWQVAELQGGQNLNISAISINRAPINTSGFSDTLYPTVIDTTFAEMVVPAQLYDAISTAMNAYCDDIPYLCAEDSFFGRNPHCHFVDPPELRSYPSLTLTIDAPGDSLPVQLELPPNLWLIPTQSKGYCAAIVPGEQPGIRLGTQVLTGYYTSVNFTDATASFAPSSNCSGAIYKLAYVSGNNQRGAVSTAAKNRLVVRVLSIFDSSPVQGIYVNFQVVQGSASISDVQVSGPDGLASASFRYGYSEGQITVTATLGLAIGSPVVFFQYAERPVVYLVLSILFTTLLIIGVGILYFVTNRHRKAQHQKLVNSPLYHLLEVNLKQH